jgi:hypothetical protein
MNPTTAKARFTAMPETPDPNAQTPAATGDPATGGGTQTPEGFVPKADFEKTEAQRREFQANLDKQTQENARLQRELAEARTGTPDPAQPPAPVGFDPQTFRQELMRDVLNANTLRSAADAAKIAFPHADPSIFTDRLAEFGSPEALRLAAEVSHTRVQTVLDAQKAEVEKTVREEFAATHGGGTPPPANSGAIPGDPTAQELAKMTIAQLNELEDRTPGVINRVLRSAS